MSEKTQVRHQPPAKILFVDIFLIRNVQIRMACHWNTDCFNQRSQQQKTDREIVYYKMSIDEISMISILNVYLSKCKQKKRKNKF